MVALPFKHRLDGIARRQVCVFWHHKATICGIYDTRRSSIWRNSCICPSTSRSAHPARGHGCRPACLGRRGGRRIFEAGGCAAEAAVAVAASLAVVYPHMNSMGGDSFWLIAQAGQAPVAVDGCGRAAHGADLDLYKGHQALSCREPAPFGRTGVPVSCWLKTVGMR
jgi:hypothetical protein